MKKIRYGISPWLDRQPKSRRPEFAPSRRHLEVDVVVLGGGLTGCLTAHGLSVAGVSTALVDAERIGGASTGHGLGLALAEPQVDFGSLSRTYGLRAARRVWQGARRGARDLAAQLKRLGVRCDLASAELVEMALGPEDERTIERAVKARAAAGLDGTRLAPAALRRRTGGVGCAGAVVSGNVVLDPYRACLGVARAAAKRGALIVERCETRAVRVGCDGVEIRTSRGTIEADSVVVATGQVPPMFRDLQRHCSPMETYAVLTPPLPAAVRKEMARRDIVLRDAWVPPHYLRWTRKGQVMFAGADQVPPHPRSRERTLVQRTGQLMYELSTIYPAISGIQPEYGWSASYGMTRDRLPLIGTHRSHPRHLFALGLEHGGLGLAYLASRILLRHHLGEPTKDDEVFGFGRLRTRR